LAKEQKKNQQSEAEAQEQPAGQPPAGGAAEQQQQQAQQQQQQQAVRAPEVVVDETQAHAAYANFARVTATPEEVIIDFGLNPQPFAMGRQEVKIAQRLIMNFYTAKRLLGALQMTIQRHEAAFGVIELDVRRRANLPPAAARAAGAGAPQPQAQPPQGT